jgi:hypothetical protein
MGIGVPLSLGAIYGIQKLTSNIIGHGQYNFREPLVRDIDTLTGRVFEIPTDRATSLSGFNTRSMPTAPHHIGQSTENTLGVLQNDIIGNIRKKTGRIPIKIKEVSNTGISPPTLL